MLLSLSYLFCAAAQQMSKQVVYQAQKIPKGKGPRYWKDWIKLWRFRWGLETGIDELEPRERFLCCTTSFKLIITIFLGFVFFAVSILLIRKLFSWFGII